MRLQQEGVVVNAAGRVDLERFGWEIRTTSPRTKSATRKKRATNSSSRPPAKKKAAGKSAAGKRSRR
jgi:hypothetical protein